MESYILNIIKTDDNWRDVIISKGIRVKEEPPFAIFNYGVDTDPLDPVVREARGIIIDLDKQSVVCWPFTRFYNSYEEAAKEDLHNFDWDHCRVEEKIDGSICKCWYNEYSGKWQWSTNSCIDANNATSFSDITFQRLIESAINYNRIVFEALNKDTTYIFELVSPYQQIVIKYSKTALFHIGSRNNKTGNEDWLYIGVPHPRIMYLHTLNDCLAAVEKMNHRDGIIDEEGFVVVDKNWRRLKIKSPEYVAAHKIKANANIGKDHILEVIRKHPEEIDDLCQTFPDLAVYYRYYQFRMAELEYDISRFIAYTRNLYEEYNHDRKAVAMTIMDSSLAAFGFEALKSDVNAKELIANISKAKISKLIPEYKAHSVICEE